MKKTTKKKVTNKKTTHVSVILDRSGSMQQIKDDIIGGFNAFLTEQKKTKNKMTLTLVQFDDQGPYDVIYDMLPITKVPTLTNKAYTPRGMTPLLDCIGKGITELETQRVNMARKTRPENVVVVIITDGQENSSKEFKKDQIAKMIKDKQDLGWQFVFLSADLNSIGDAHAYGFAGAATMAYDATAKGTGNMFRSLAINVSNYANGTTQTVAFTSEDRKKQDLESKTRTK